ncbi:MAG: NAD(P)/FAD-dependent oxidoreductase [Clostridia bacterium]|nr:NAD(P)/FAD-dependent oxidoreductase [Clostridia bacterium]
MKKYDCIIVGAGPFGIYAAYELMLKKENDFKVLVIDQGKDIYSRRCPILEKKLKKCPARPDGSIGCLPSCSLTTGFGGSGAYSDGKFNITSEFGGWLNEYIDNDEVLDLIKYVDNINIKHGAPKKITDPTTPEVLEIEKKGIAVGLKLLKAQVRHLGTEVNLKVLSSIYEELKKQIDFMFQTEVKDILVENNKVTGIELLNGEKINSTYVMLGVGRTGAEWLSKVLSAKGVEFDNNRVDIGVRVETSNIVMDEINKNLYEGKFIYNTSVGTRVRTFCSNPSGHVVIENHHGVSVCNGHSYNDKKLGSDNTNFALLVSQEFEKPFKNSNEYSYEISKLANKLSHGSVIVQKFGDIKKGRRSTPKRIDEGFIKPTLKEAVPGDLGLVLPYNTMKSLIEMIEALDHVTPGIASDHTLLYGVEAKFYSDRPVVNNKFETQIHNLYVGGDGAGVTRGLAQAGANGVKIAREIILKNKDKM